MPDVSKVIAAAAARETPRPEELEVWYLVPEFDEEQIAHCWLRKHDPTALTQERVTTALEIKRLNRGMIVHALVRRPDVSKRKGLRPTQPVSISPIDGALTTLHTEPEEHIDEVDPGQGVRVDEFWEMGVSRFVSNLRKAEFFSTLAQQASPWKLSYADGASHKSNDANWLVLRNC